MMRVATVARRIIVALSAVAVAGCGEKLGITQPGAGSQPLSAELSRSIERLGFSPRGAVDLGSLVRVEGDILLSKEELLHPPMAPLTRSLVLGSDTTKKTRVIPPPDFQWVTNATVSISNVENIVVDLTQISNDSNWLAAARQAMANWNSLPGTAVQFREGSPADIVFSWMTLTDYPAVEAQSQIPNGTTHKPGNSVQINTAAFPLDSLQKLTTLTHELGHTIGFRHTNWQYYVCNGQVVRESQNPDGANQISGTPATDNLSIMNACNASVRWAGFSPYDSTATMVLYPFVPSLTELESSDGHPMITWSSAWAQLRGANEIAVTLRTEYREVDDNYQWVYSEYFSGVGSASTDSWFVDYSDTWGYSGCASESEFPYPEQHTYYDVVLTYPRGVQIQQDYATPANVQSGAGWESCY